MKPSPWKNQSDFLLVKDIYDTEGTFGLLEVGPERQYRG